MLNFALARNSASFPLSSMLTSVWEFVIKSTQSSYMEFSQLWVVLHNDPYVIESGLGGDYDNSLF